MRGSDQQNGSLFSYVNLEERVPARHPLRKIKAVVDPALTSLDADFSRLYAGDGRPSIAPERLLRAALIQILFSIRSERQLMEQLEYNLLFRWFVGLGIDEPVLVPTVFTSQKKRKQIEEPFGWGKTVGPIRKTMLRGLNRVRAQFTLTMAAYNLAKLPNLLAA